MRTIEHKNIPYGGGGQVLIQVQLIYSLPFVTTLENNNKKKMEHDQIFNTVCPLGILHNKDDFRSGCRNVSQCQLKQSFLGLYSLR